MVSMEQYREQKAREAAVPDEEDINPAQKYLRDRIVELGEIIEQQRSELREVESDARMRRDIIARNEKEMQTSGDALAVLIGTKKVER